MNIKQILKDHKLWLDTRGKEGKRAVLISVCLRGASLTNADLRSANFTNTILANVDFTNVDLTNANLTNADLENACLKGARLWNTKGDGAYIKNINIKSSPYKIAYTKSVLQIGCKQYSFEKWKSFTNSEIGTMDRKALAFWKANKKYIFDFIKDNPCK